MTTEIGGIAHLTQAVEEGPSPLQQEMVRVTRIVTLLALFCGVGFFALGRVTGVLSLEEGFLLALGVIVANVPEGLLVTLILVPPFPALFGLAPLRFAEWGILLAFPPTLLLLEETRKWMGERWASGREDHGRTEPRPARERVSTLGRSRPMP